MPMSLSCRCEFRTRTRARHRAVVPPGARVSAYPDRLNCSIVPFSLGGD